jgi:hypothetical protein
MNNMVSSRSIRAPRMSCSAMFDAYHSTLQLHRFLFIRNLTIFFFKIQQPHDNFVQSRPEPVIEANRQTSNDARLH